MYVPNLMISIINMHSFSLFPAFFKLWNTHLHLTPCYGDSHLGQILENFIDQYGLKIHRDNLYGNFVLHLSNLSNFENSGCCNTFHLPKGRHLPEYVQVCSDVRSKTHVGTPKSKGIRNIKP